MPRSDSPEGTAAASRLPIVRTVLTALLLRRFGLLPMLGLLVAGRHIEPARRCRILTIAAGVYLAAALLLVLVLAVLVGGLALVALTV